MHTALDLIKLKLAILVIIIHTTIMIEVTCEANAESTTVGLAILESSSRD